MLFQQFHLIKEISLSCGICKYGKFHNNPSHTHRNKGPETCHFCPSKSTSWESTCPLAYKVIFFVNLVSLGSLISMSLQQIIIKLCIFTKFGILHVNWFMEKFLWFIWKMPKNCQYFTISSKWSLLLFYLAMWHFCFRHGKKTLSIPLKTSALFTWLYSW